jgi:hypothetical protein
LRVPERNKIQFKTQHITTFGSAWIFLCCAFLIHVIDEALNDFLDLYNPTVAELTKAYPFLPLPIFTFDIWLTGLLLVITLLFILSYYAFQQRKWIIILSYFYATIMLLNGLGHILGSFYLGDMMPGVFSSPLLLLTSVNLFWQAGQIRSEKVHKQH